MDHFVASPILDNSNGFVVTHCKTHSNICNLGKTMPCLPPMTGNGNHTTYKNGDDWERVSYCFTHIICTPMVCYDYVRRCSLKNWMPSWRSGHEARAFLGDSWEKLLGRIILGTG